MLKERIRYEQNVILLPKDKIISFFSSKLLIKKVGLTSIIELYLLLLYSAILNEKAAYSQNDKDQENKD